jgi:hypothetical protein
MYSRVEWVGLVPCIVAAAFATGCGGSNDDAATEAKIREAKADARAEERKSERLRRIEAKLKDQEKGNSGGGSDGGGTPSITRTPQAQSTTNCGDGVTAGPNTTCPFALNVRDEYYSSGESSVIEVHSPRTGGNYTMTCGGSGPYHCTGGNNASVTFP